MSAFLFVAGVILVSEPQATAVVIYLQTSYGSELQHFQIFEAQLPIPPAAAIEKRAETAKKHQVKIMSPPQTICAELFQWPAQSVVIQWRRRNVACMKVRRGGEPPSASLC